MNFICLLVTSCLVAKSFCCNELGCFRGKQIPSVENRIDVKNFNAKLGKNYTNKVKINKEDNYKFFVNTIHDNVISIYEYDPLRFKIIVLVSTNETTDINYPVLFTIVQNRGEVVSFPIPFTRGDRNNKNSDKRAVCISKDVGNDRVGIGNIIQIRVSTQSPTEVQYNLNVFKDFMHIELNTKVTTTISVGEPEYFYFAYTDTATENLIIKVTTEQRICTIFAIQEPKCPVFVEEHNVRFGGRWQTLFTRSAMSIKRDLYKNGFFIKFIMAKHDSTCDDSSVNTGLKDNTDKSNKITIVVEESNFEAQGSLYNLTFAVFAPSALCVLVVVVFGYLYLRGFEQSINNKITNLRKLGSKEVNISEIAQESTVDHFKDHIAPNVSTRYFAKMMISMGILFAIPVFSLTSYDAAVMSETGNLDSCYYNDLCSNPYEVFSFNIRDFNHIVSNFPYCFLGIGYEVIAWRKSIICFEHYTDNDSSGVQIHFGLYYAMGVSLIMEGLMSAAYHLCPNKANFPYDTCYMYMMCVLCILKLYENRHPKHMGPNMTFVVLASFTLVAALGFILENYFGFYWLLSFKIILVVIHIVVVIYFSIYTLYLGNVIWRSTIVDNVDQKLLSRKDFMPQGGPMYRVTLPINQIRHRYFLIGFYIVVNIGVWMHVFYNDLAHIILTLLISNLGVYFTYYCFMKCWQKEMSQWEGRVIWPFVYLALSVVFGVSAMWFFTIDRTEWKKTAAESREGNGDCILMNFYDEHDLWHLLSGLSIFFLFMTLLSLDDALLNNPKTKILLF